MTLITDVLVSLTFAKPGDVRKPITASILVEEVESGIVSNIDLDEHQTMQLLSGSVVQATEAVQVS